MGSWMIKEPLWPLSQAKLNIEKVLFGCVTGQTQDSTHARPLAFFLLLSCLLCVYMYVSWCTGVGQRAAGPGD